MQQRHSPLRDSVPTTITISSSKQRQISHEIFFFHFFFHVCFSEYREMKYQRTGTTRWLCARARQTRESKQDARHYAVPLSSSVSLPLTLCHTSQLYSLDSVSILHRPRIRQLWVYLYIVKTSCNVIRSSVREENVQTFRNVWEASPSNTRDRGTNYIWDSRDDATTWYLTLVKIDDISHMERILGIFSIII